ncbi:hypothetical protein AJ87_29730 [Rhizobium yanglingense]|nr:hypothetical protein AJ87_29730 [Rhizobium yanglingense]
MRGPLRMRLATSEYGFPKKGDRVSNRKFTHPRNRLWTLTSLVVTSAQPANPKLAMIFSPGRLCDAQSGRGAPMRMSGLPIGTTTVSPPLVNTALLAVISIEELLLMAIRARVTTSSVTIAGAVAAGGCAGEPDPLGADDPMAAPGAISNMLLFGFVCGSDGLAVGVAVPV